LKVYLIVSPDVAAKRISVDNNTSAERNSSSKNASLDEIKKLNVDRDKGDILRYRKIYGIKDFTDKKNYNLIIDTSKLTPEKIVGKILKYV
jgi:cytidylate kinase